MMIGAKYLPIATLFATAFAAKVVAHHSFNTEFEAELEGKVEGVVTRVWWANPHIRYEVDMTMADGSIEKWSLNPPGNLPAYRRQNWSKETIQVGSTVKATGNLGRGGMRKLYATCITLDSGRQLGRCVTPGSTTKITASSTIDYSYKPNEYQVDIRGFWDNRYKFHVTVDDFQPKPMPLTSESRAIYEARKYGDDQVLRCLPPGLPRIFGSPYPMQIVDAGTHYLIVFLQGNTPRWVYMDNRKALDDQPLTSMGFSIGRWEGQILVIETTHLSPGWLDGSGYPMSGGADTKIVERWHMAEDGLSIDRTMTIHDVLYSKPLVRTRGSQRGDEKELLESPPCDATSFYSELLQRGELENLLK